MTLLCLSKIQMISDNFFFFFENQIEILLSWLTDTSKGMLKLYFYFVNQKLWDHFAI